MTARDTQRQRVYDAERAIQDVTGSMSIAECQALVDRVLASKYIVQRFDRIRTGRIPARVTVEAGRNGGLAYPQFGVIRLGRWARQPVVVLHELAHVIVGINSRTAAHGWQFTECMLVLVRRFVGPEAHDTLRESYRSHGVRFTKPRARRVLTDEQRAVAIANLAAARKAPTTARRALTWSPGDPTDEHTCTDCGRSRPATKFPTTRTAGEREARCRECRDR